MTQKIKSWAEKYEMTPSETVWQQVEKRIHPIHQRSRIRSLTTLWMRAAAILIFIWVSIALMNKYNIDNEYFNSSNKQSFQINNLNINDVSIYYSPARIHELKTAYRKLSME